MNRQNNNLNRSREKGFAKNKSKSKDRTEYKTAPYQQQSKMVFEEENENPPMMEFTNDGDEDLRMQPQLGSIAPVIQYQDVSHQRVYQPEPIILENNKRVH